MREPPEDGSVAFTVTLPPELADEIKALDTELNLKPPLLTATLITVGLSCTDFVRRGLRLVQQEASKTRSSGGRVH